MTGLSDLNVGTLGTRLVNTAAGIAGEAWTNIKSVVAHELRVLAGRIRDIAEAALSGEVSKTGARTLLRVARNNLAATIAMTSVLLLAAAQKLINAVLGEVKNFVNGAIGFKLL
ncbi:hypothetical protein SLH49_21970 [Cognatiyoonia sp. IB215446]|uniref:hypothetical protein n=1 Tax=Cognatiyoonia sp. IB215446 TaxID=3097355 RepID=UPI002A0ED7EA|nr:hypothetical protein [Cognatiyoonia sp. IB215446]MDX8350666.1 hypothetical protein [Cognatiyoonia sp. IB215446]